MLSVSGQRFKNEKKMFTRRNFLKGAGAAAAGVGLSALCGCAQVSPGLLFWVRKGNNLPEPSGPWDPVFGPPIQWFSRYGGPGDFQGHIRGGAAPGVDYDVPEGTPLVPSMMSYLIQINQDRKGSRFVLMNSVFYPPFQVSYGHLGEMIVDEQFRVAGDISRFLGKRIRILNRAEIIALSGNSGLGPWEYGGIQPPHLHLSAFWDDGNYPYQNLDPEKLGPEGGRPIFWDGRVFMDAEPKKRLSLLNQTLQHLESEMAEWVEGEGLDDVKGNLREYSLSMGRLKDEDFLESKHFQDLKAYLKKSILEKKKFIPGSGPYSLMLKILSYSTDPRQKVILTLPFSAPGLETLYRKTRYKEGQFLTIRPPQEQGDLKKWEQGP